MIAANGTQRAPAASPSDANTTVVKLQSAEERERVSRWRQVGADENTQMFCLAVDRLEQIVDANAARHHHVLVTSFPKSGSTYLQKVLAHITGFRPYWLNTAGHDNERNLEVTSIPMLLVQDTVTQEHMRATRANVQWLRRLGVRPVVLVRNIFDVIVSSRDHSTDGDICGPNAHTPAAFTHWTREEQAWFIIRMGVPWYLTFFTSWQDAQRELPVMWITYEDAVNCTAETVRRILEHSGVKCPADLDDRVAEVNTNDVRFNRGVCGRGESELTEAQKQAVRDLAAAHQGAFDFSMIGM